MGWADKVVQIYNHQPGCVNGGLNSEVFSLWVQSSKMVEIGLNRTGHLSFLTDRTESGRTFLTFYLISMGYQFS